ncbi:MAG: PDZ domain-containing protein [Pirellula sp.]
MQVPAWNGYSNGGGTFGTGLQSWQLGAVTLNSANGVLVQQVVPGSIADRAVLRSGDLIVSVAGSQVGFTGGRLVDLIYEINRRVDANGQVRLTVLDAVSRQLRTKTLSITPQHPSSGAVTGRVFMDRANGWSGNYTLKVELLNVSRPYLSASG